jgi:hypothetical protein
MKLCNLFSKLIDTHSNALFDDIVDYNHIKRLFVYDNRSSDNTSVIAGKRMLILS